MPNIPSLKKFLISIMCEFPDIEVLQDNQINLITPVGVISGKLFKHTDGKNVLDAVTKAIEKYEDDYKKDYDIGDDLPGNDGFIVLENVTIQMAGNTTVKYDQLTVFFDQIIGITCSKTIAGN